MRHASLALYRKLLRAVKDFPVAPVARKLHHNIREVFEVHRAEQDPSNIERLHSDGGAALQVIAFLRHLPQVQCTVSCHREYAFAMEYYHICSAGSLKCTALREYK